MHPLLHTALRALVVMSVAAAAHAHEPMAHMHGTAPPAEACPDAALACATAATPAFDARGRLWLAWTGGGAVSVAASGNGGGHFDPPVVIARPGASLDLGADARPQIVIDGHGRITVAYGVFKDAHWNAQVMLATSDDGQRFTPPRSLFADAASQRFPALALDSDGSLFAAWLDKRTVAAARARGVAQPGAAVAYAWSDDGGQHFAGDTIAQDHSCECCRLAVAFDGAHHPVVMLRRVYGERERDHAVFSFDDQRRPTGEQRVAEDHWAIDGCPHQGPALAVSGDGTWHAAWYTQGQARQGLFYARSTDRGVHFSAPRPIGDAAHEATRPAFWTFGHTVWLAWKEFDGHTVSVKLRRSVDDGQSWSADEVVASTQGRSDHPVLVGNRDGRVYLSWLTAHEGYRLVEVGR